VNVYTPAEREAFQPPPCPHCGAPGTVQWIATPTDRDDTLSMPGLFECSARCFEDDPDGYEAAVKAHRTAAP